MFYEEIRFNKNKKFLFLMPSIVMIMPFIIVTLLSAMLIHETFWRERLPIIGYILLQGLILVTFVFLALFSRTLLLKVKKMLKGEPAIILNDKGITDISAQYTFGFISWDEIKDIESFRGGIQGNMGFIALEIDDLEGFIASKPLITRLMLRAQAKNYGNVLVINTTLLEGHFKPVVRQIKEAWEQHRRK